MKRGVLWKQFSGGGLLGMSISAQLKVPHTTSELPNKIVNRDLIAQWTMFDKKSVEQLPQSWLHTTLFPKCVRYINLHTVKYGYQSLNPQA